MRGAIGVLEHYDFAFGKYAEPKTKLTSIIAVNLISPKIDYHGHDKSRIDTQPYTNAIIRAIKKIAGDVKTFKAAGFKFTSKNQERIYNPNYGHSNARKALRDLLRDRKAQVEGY